MAETQRARSMGPTQLIAWLVCLMFSFVAVLFGLISMYSTRVLDKEVTKARDELAASRTLRTEQVELLRDIRDLLRGDELKAVPARIDVVPEDTATGAPAAEE